MIHKLHYLKSIIYSTIPIFVISVMKMPKKDKKISKQTGEEGKEAKIEAIATVRAYQSQILDLGEIAIVGYVPLEESIISEKIESTSTVEALKGGARILEKWKGIMKNKIGQGLVVVELAGRGFIVHLGSYIGESSWPELLFHRPARLNAVGRLENEGGEWKIKWIKKSLPKEFYIYEGELRFSGQPFDVVFDTDQGLKVMPAEGEAVAERDNASRR